MTNKKLVDLMIEVREQLEKETRNVAETIGALETIKFFLLRREFPK